MPERTGPRFTLSFGGMLASVMVALKLKERWDDYKQISTDEEGRVALGSSVYRDHDPEGNNDEAISLINTDITVTRPKRKRAKCCMCCGLDCSLFWKAFGIASSINRPESSPETVAIPTRLHRSLLLNRPVKPLPWSRRRRGCLSQPAQSWKTKYATLCSSVS
ncbi:hypothetical protein C8R47DRAFT_694316 [Mycena vitilis]|nr:hypothetical protein C8R47DRAFT_694316 [Mycena vitilis]